MKPALKSWAWGGYFDVPRIAEAERGRRDVRASALSQIGLASDAKAVSTVA